MNLLKVFLTIFFAGFLIFFTSCNKENFEEEIINFNDENVIPPVISNNLSTVDERLLKENLDNIEVSNRNAWQFFKGMSLSSNSGYDFVEGFYTSNLESFDFKVRVKSNKTGRLDAWFSSPFRRSKYEFTSNDWKELIVTGNDMLPSEDIFRFFTFTSENYTYYEIEIYYRLKETIPNGWSMIESETGINLFEKNNRYVQEIDLSEGAYITLKQGTNSIGNTNNPSPAFRRKTLNWYWQNKASNTVAATNCQFFNLDGDLTDEVDAFLSFPIKDNSTVISAGSHNNQESGNKLKFGIDITSQQAWIASYNYDGNNYNTASNNLLSPLVIVGFHPTNVDKWKYFSTGRTMVGIKDSDGDGKKEKVYIITGKGTQFTIKDILEDDFGCTDVMMLDGSGSSQMTFNGTEYFPSSDDRTIPSVMYAIEG